MRTHRNVYTPPHKQLPFGQKWHSHHNLHLFWDSAIGNVSFLLVSVELLCQALMSQEARPGQVVLYHYDQVTSLKA